MSSPARPAVSGPPHAGRSRPASESAPRRPAVVVAALALVQVVTQPLVAILFGPLSSLGVGGVALAHLAALLPPLLLIALAAAGIQLLRSSRTDGGRLALLPLWVMGLVIVLHLVQPVQQAAQLLLSLAVDLMAFLAARALLNLLSTGLMMLCCLAIGTLAVVIVVRHRSPARTVRIPLPATAAAVVVAGLLVVLAVVRPLAGALQRLPAAQQAFERSPATVQPLAIGVVGALVLAVGALLVALADGPALLTAWLTLGLVWLVDLAVTVAGSVSSVAQIAGWSAPGPSALITADITAAAHLAGITAAVIAAVITLVLSRRRPAVGAGTRAVID